MAGDPEDTDPIEALLEDVSGDRPDPRRDPPSDSGDFLVADLVRESGQRAAVPRRRPAAPPLPPTPAPPAPGRGLDRGKLERLLVVGAGAGLCWFLVSLWLRPPIEDAQHEASRSEALVAALEAATPEDLGASLVTELARAGLAVAPHELPLHLEAAGLPGREAWNRALAGPRELARAEDPVRRRFLAVAARLAGWNRKLVARGGAPAWVHAEDPLGCEERIEPRLRAHAATLRALAGQAAPGGAGAAPLLVALRDCTRSISRRATGELLGRALDLEGRLGWSLELAPAATLLGQADPPTGDVSPAALAAALVHLGRARSAARRGQALQDELLTAARLLLPGFPTPADAFGASWARAAARLYMVAGHPGTALEVTAAFAERARGVGEVVELGTAALRDLLTEMGRDSPPRLEALWSQHHGGAPPGEPGWWRTLAPAPRTPSGLMGMLPTTARIQGLDRGGAELSEAERQRRYARFRRRRGSGA